MSDNATDCLIKEAAWQLDKSECVTYSIANELISCVKNQQDRIRRLEDALRVLHDEQNGPPLLRRKKSWQAAMGKAAALLEESK